MAVDCSTENRQKQPPEARKAVETQRHTQQVRFSKRYSISMFFFEGNAAEGDKSI